MNVTNLGLSWNSRYFELSPTEMALAAVAALLVGGAVLYVLLKVLRSKPVKMLGMALLLATVALMVGWRSIGISKTNARALLKSGVALSKTLRSKISNPAWPIAPRAAQALSIAWKS